MFEEVVEELNNLNSSVSCLLVGESAADLIVNIEEFKKEPTCSITLKSYKDILGFYKNIPVIKTDKVKGNEVYALYKGKTKFNVNPIYIDWEVKWKQ